MITDTKDGSTNRWRHDDDGKKVNTYALAVLGGRIRRFLPIHVSVTAIWRSGGFFHDPWSGIRLPSNGCDRAAFDDEIEIRH